MSSFQIAILLLTIAKICDGYLEFSTSSSKVTVSDTSKINAIGSGSFSISLFFQATVYRSYSVPLLSNRESATYSAFMVAFYTGYKPFIQLKINYIPDSSTTEYIDGYWHHLVITRHSNAQSNKCELKYYINGNDIYTRDRDSTGGCTHSIASDGSLLFGYDAGDRRGWIGNLAQISLWKKALTATEILTIYNNIELNQSSMVFTDDLLHYYPLNEAEQECENDGIIYDVWSQHNGILSSSTDPKCVNETFLTGVTFNPTLEPTMDPTIMPTEFTQNPTVNPTLEPTFNPTLEPTFNPILEPTVEPTMDPTIMPTEFTQNPTVNPTPTYNPTFSPNKKPTLPEATSTTLESIEYFNKNSSKDNTAQILIIIGISVCVIALCSCFYVLCVFNIKRNKRRKLKKIEKEMKFNMSASPDSAHKTPNAITDIQMNELANTQKGAGAVGEVVHNTDYRMWTVQQTYEWIMGLENGFFGMYSNELLTNLFTENVNGECIESMNVNDLHRLGVIDFKHKKMLLQFIKELKCDMVTEEVA